MKIAASIAVVVILVGCAAGLFITYQSLGSTQDMLQETRDSLQETQTQLQITADSLEETKTELQDTTNSLGVTRQELEEQKSQTENYVQLYESGRKELGDLEDELDSVNNKYSALQQTNRSLQNTIDDLQSQLALYQDTLGIQVFSGVMPPYRSGNLAQITLTDYSSAGNPTWQQLEQFLREDKTDKNLYVTGVYECGNFAKDLHNNAEARGIRAAFVAIHFYESTSHAINAFRTLDRGLVYIDVTGRESNINMANLDKTVEIAKDEIYNQYFVFPEGLYIFEGGKLVKSIEIYW